MAALNTSEVVVPDSQSAGEEGRPVGPQRCPVDVLVVDDSPVKLQALAAALEPLGERVVSASSGREALRLLLAHDFATVVLDVNMPDLDGFETARMIRSRPRSASTPIIFTSATSIEETDAWRGYALGAVDYICAPISPEILRAKVSVFVELHRRTEEARTQARVLGERTRELEKSQRELRLSERMAAIGTLCAGLGHDMGNLLLPISVWTESLEVEALPEQVGAGVENLRACVQYLRKLAAGLRLVSLDPAQDGGGERVELATWITEIEPILGTALPRGVDLQLDIAEALPPVRIAPHRLAQVTFNLVQNAGDALQSQDHATVRIAARREGAAGIRFSVTDNGPGMSPDVRAHCLDPFFTTKKRGISTGLGLSLVHGIVQAIGSGLDIESSPGCGTTFSFVLPPWREESLLEVDALITINDPRRRAIADAITRATGCRIVPQLGHDENRPVVWVIDGDGAAAEALAFLARPRRRVLILDATRERQPDGARAATLTGPRGLAAQLREFMADLQSETPASPDVPGPAIQEDNVSARSPRKAAAI